MELVELNDLGIEVDRVSLKKRLSLPKVNLLNCLTVDVMGNIIIASPNIIYVLDSEMRLLNIIDAKKNHKIVNVIRTNSGSIICGIQKDDMNEGGILCELDTVTGEWGETLPLVEESVIDEYCLMEGKKYDFYYKDAGGVYGYNSEQGVWTTVMDARYSLLTAQDIEGMIGEDKELFFGLLSNSENSDKELVVTCYSKIKPEELENKKIITYAGYNVPNKLRTVAREFNKTHRDCRIEIQLYEDEEQVKMTLDMASGKVPDVLPLFSSDLPTEQLVKKGILEDLTPYWENDAEISTEDIIPSVLEGMKINDRLYFVSPYFTIASAACRTCDAEGKEGWTIEEMSEVLKDKGEDAIVFKNPDKEDMLYNFLISTLNDFINWETGECNFCSQDFKDILRLCNSGFITEKMSDKEYEDLNEEIEKKMHEGKVLLSFSQGVTLEDIQSTRKQFGTSIKYIGLPEKNRQGSYFNFTEQYGIYSGSDVKKEAWEFIKMVMSEEYQINVNHINYGMLPTRKDALEWKLQAQTATEEYEDSYGNWIQPVEADYGMSVPSQEDVDTLLNLIDRTRKHAVIDDEGILIVLEEAESYFNEKKSLDKVAEIIQKRMTTYVNEKR